MSKIFIITTKEETKRLEEIHMCVDKLFDEKIINPLKEKLSTCGK